MVTCYSINVTIYLPYFFCYAEILPMHIMVQICRKKSIKYYYHMNTLVKVAMSKAVKNWNNREI